MELNIVRMSNTITDKQVVHALQAKREEFMSSCTGIMNVEEQWAFNHILTVLDHASKIFTVPAEQLQNIKQELNKES